MAGFFKIHCKSLARKATVGLLCSLLMNNCGGPEALITSLTQSPLFPYVILVISIQRNTKRPYPRVAMNRDVYDSVVQFVTP